MQNTEILNSDGFSQPMLGRRYYPELMTEEELIEYLRIPEISKSKDHHNVVENLKRMRDLPRITLCNKNLYPLAAVRQWAYDQISQEK